MAASSRWSPRITGRIPGRVPGRESVLTRSGEPVETKMTKTPEPEDKLDAATTTVGVVNGPEDAPFDWRQINWRRMEDDVRRLRQRIFTASKAGDLKKVRNLQKLMMRSRANTLLSVRRVTERNAGRLTAGVDGEVVLTPEAKAKLADRVHQNAEPFKALPVRRVYIPKPGSRNKRRPLGIPVIADRAHQARVVNALEPEWEARFEPKSYGFRPGRGCHDAIQAVYEVVKGKRPRRLWALDADLAQAFDRIGHDHILAMLGTFPARGMVAQWLKAGVVEQGRLHRTEDGVPQGGVISPVLLNVALHGMEEAAGARYKKSGREASQIAAGGPSLIRYADDLIALCHSRQEALEVKARLATWLAPRGLAFNEDKTRVVTLDEGFDFLGFNVRRYGTKPLIKPSKAAQRRIRERLRTEMRSLRGTNAQAVIKRLNPIIRGWAAYYRTQVSSKRVQPAGSLPVDAHLQVGQVQPPEQTEDLGRSPVLRQVQQVQRRPVGVRRSQERRLHAQVPLDPHPPPPARQARGVPRRPRACRLLGLATTQGSAAADQQDHPGAHQLPGRSLHDLRRLPVRRRGPATEPARVGDMAGHPHRGHHDRDAGPDPGRGGCTPSHTRRLPTQPRTGTAGRLQATRACLSRMR
jgi:RNA-directed DNA polymerase